MMNLKRKLYHCKRPWHSRKKILRLQAFLTKSLNEFISLDFIIDKTHPPYPQTISNICAVFNV